MKLTFSSSVFILMAIILFAVTCNNNSVTANEPALETPSFKHDSSKLVVTNPNFVIAPVEYSILNEKALNLFSRFKFDARVDT